MTDSNSDGAAEEHEPIETEYLNTDLFLVASRSLEALAAHLGGVADLLSCDEGPDGNWYVTVEAEDSGGEDGDPARDMAALLDVLEGLPSEHAATLAVCEAKELNIGLGVGETWAHVVRVSAELGARAAALGLAIGFTTYPIGEEDGPVVYVDEDGNPIDPDAEVDPAVD